MGREGRGAEGGGDDGWEGITRGTVPHHACCSLACAGHPAVFFPDARQGNTFGRGGFQEGDRPACTCDRPGLHPLLCSERGGLRQALLACVGCCGLETPWTARRTPTQAVRPGLEGSTCGPWWGGWARPGSRQAAAHKGQAAWVADPGQWPRLLTASSVPSYSGSGHPVTPTFCLWPAVLWLLAV